MEGAELSARFALPPNSRKYCGRPSFRNALAAYLGEKSDSNLKRLQFEISQFTAHAAYLKLIADANGLSPFDYRVAEAFWLGNGLLGKVGREKLPAMIREKFVGPGKLTPERADALASSIPKGMAPHHTFHVLHLHTITGVIEPSDANAELCRPSWGKVLKAGRLTLEIATQKLARKNGKLSLVPCRKKVKRIADGILLVPDAKAGDLVAVHWGIAVVKLSKPQARRLEAITRRNLATLAP